MISRFMSVLDTAYFICVNVEQLGVETVIWLPQEFFKRASVAVGKTS